MGWIWWINPKFNPQNAHLQLQATLAKWQKSIHSGWAPKRRSHGSLIYEPRESWWSPRLALGPSILTRKNHSHTSAANHQFAYGGGKKKNHGWQRLQPKSCCTTWPDSCTSTGPLTKHNNIVLLVSPRASQSRHLRPRSNRSQCALANWEVLWNSMSFMPYIFCEYPTCIYIYIQYPILASNIQQHPTEIRQVSKYWSSTFLWNVHHEAPRSSRGPSAVSCPAPRTRWATPSWRFGARRKLVHWCWLEEKAGGIWSDIL